MLNKSNILKMAAFATLIGLSSGLVASPAVARDRGANQGDQGWNRDNRNQDWGRNRFAHGRAEVQRLLDWTRQLQAEVRSDMRSNSITPQLADSAVRNLRVREIVLTDALAEGGMSNASFAESEGLLNKIQTNMRADVESHRGSDRGDRGDRGGRGGRNGY